MHIPTHLMSGWCVGAALPLTGRERAVCMAVATLPDLDGLSLAFGRDAYERWHHVIGHNIFAGVLLAAGGAMMARASIRGRFFCLGLALFHLHLLMDFYGSGPGWQIHYGWPITDRGLWTEDAWEFGAWQNYAAMLGLLVVSVAFAVWKQITPFELVAPGIDSDLRRLMHQRRTSR
jgi:hypothetical protein